MTKQTGYFWTKRLGLNTSAQNEYEEIIKELEEGESYHQGYTKERQQIYARITELTVEKVRLRNNSIIYI